MKKIWRNILISLSVFFVAYIMIKRTGVMQGFTLESMRRYGLHLAEVVEAGYWRAVFSYLVSCVAVILTGIPATGLFAMVAGFLFGIPLGVAYTTIAAVIGSIITVIVVRRVLANMLHKRYQKRLEKFDKYMAQYGQGYLVALHLLTIVPLVAINILAALAGVSLWTVIWTTIVGSVPVYFLYVMAGRELFTITAAHEILKPHILLLLLLLALAAVMPMIVRWIAKRRGL